MTDQELRSAWLDTQARLEKIEKQLSIDNRSQLDCNRKTSLDNLINRYKTFACMSFGMTFCSFGWFGSHLLDTPYGKLLSFLMAGYFLIAAIMDTYLMRGIKSINLNTMTVRTVCCLVSRYKRMHHLFMMILTPFMLLILGLMISVFINDTCMIAGIVTGLIAGLAIGITQYLRFMNDYKILSDE